MRTTWTARRHLAHGPKQPFLAGIVSTNPAGWLPEVTLAEAESIAAGWKARLLRTKRGATSSNVANALIALRYAPEWNGVLHFNASALSVVAKAAPPFANIPSTPFDWADEHDVLA